jgi:hypothetical protein
MLPTKALRSVQPSAALKARVPRESYLRKLAKPEDLVPLCAPTSSLPESMRWEWNDADLPVAGARLQSRTTTTVDGLGASNTPLSLCRRCPEPSSSWPSQACASERAGVEGQRGLQGVPTAVLILFETFVQLHGRESASIRISLVPEAGRARTRLSHLRIFVRR